MAKQAQEVQQLLDTIPTLYRGPGGAVAVIKGGELIAEKTWGYADLDRRIPVTSQTLMPICSISKQMVCALLMDLENNPPPELAADGSFGEQMEINLRNMIPKSLIRDNDLTVRHLCDMQSGLRDYWALAMICGAKPDDRFTIEGDGKNMLSKYKTFHFEPGTEYSYSNINFYLLGRLIERITKEPLPKLLEERIFRPRKMTTAQLIPDTAQQPGDCLGYEGDEIHGFLPAVNRLEWSGDAGITASLSDMIAYEKSFDKEWSTRGQYYSTASAQIYKDGHNAPYSYGLSHVNIGGVTTVGHGGALRGWRIQRRYVEKERLSVVVMFNSETLKAGKAVDYIIKKALNLPDSPTSDIEPNDAWFGNFLDLETQLSVTVSRGPKGQIVVRYARDPENIRLVAPDRAETQDNKATIDRDTLKIHRVGENRHLVAQRIKEEVLTDGSRLQGRYQCSEMETTFVCEGQDNMLYGAFDGPLGRGAANLMKRLGENVWTWACPRGLDHTPPGDWTVVFIENTEGVITGCTIGCWLARRLEFLKA
jgi:CubicO group peptidase (beta-lactamase class C family)